MRNFFLSIALLVSADCLSQDGFRDSLRTFRENYVQTHEVVQGKDRSKMTFYPISKDYRIVARFKKAVNSQWLSFPTSGKMNKVYKVYGTLHFTLEGKPLQLHVYQSQDLLQRSEYRDYLFLPFTDATSGEETYEGGRYIDLTTGAIQNGTVFLDFNKAYNPYCAYVIGIYNCPLPPKENALPVAIKAGEKAYQGPN